MVEPVSNLLNFDVEQILRTSHVCDCCKGRQTCCCSIYEICITEQEMKTITGALPLASEFRPDLSDNGNVFDEEEPGLYSIDKDEKGDCVFSYRADGKILCALHSAALKANIPPHTLKPESCTLWPLSLSGPPENLISICDDAYTFHCVHHLKEPARQPAPALINSIQNLFGSKYKCTAEKNPLCTSPCKTSLIE